MFKAGLPRVFTPPRLFKHSTTIKTTVTRTCFSTSIRHHSNNKTPYIDTSKLDKNGIETPQLIQQRKNRPLSPHLTIYQPQLTWYMSSLHRLSLIFLGFTFYLLTIGFGISSLFTTKGLTTETLSNWYHDRISRMNKWVSLSIKATFSYLFALQYGGAIRHLIWDTARELSLKGVYRTGYALIGFTFIAGSYLLTL